MVHLSPHGIEIHPFIHSLFLTCFSGFLSNAVSCDLAMENIRSDDFETSSSGLDLSFI